MAERIRQESRLGREELRPSAAPVDTFTRPPADTGLLSLAEGLGNLAPAAAGLAVALRQKRLEREAEQGAEDIAVAMQRGSSANEALAAHPGSRTYKAAAKRQAAQLAAFNYGSALNTFMTEQLADETDLTEFNRKVDEFSREWETKNTPAEDGEFARGYARQAAAIRQNAVAQQSWRVGERKRQQTEEEFGKLIGAAVQGEYNWREPEGRDGRIVQSVGILRDRAFQMGIRGSRLNQLIFENVSALGIADGKPDLVEALYDVPTGPNGSAKLGDIPEYREKISRAYHAAEAVANRKDLAKDKQKDENAARILSDMQAAIIKAIEAGDDPASVDITSWKKLMNDPENGDPTKVAGLESARQAFLQGNKRQTVPVIERDLLERLYSPEAPLSFDTLREQFEKGGMGNDTYLKFRRLIESRDRVRASAKGKRLDTMMSEGLRMIGERVDAVIPLAELRPSLKGRIRALYRQMMYEWMETEEGQKASESQIRDHARLLAEILAADERTITSHTNRPLDALRP